MGWGQPQCLLVVKHFQRSSARPFIGRVLGLDLDSGTCSAVVGVQQHASWHAAGGWRSSHSPAGHPRPALYCTVHCIAVAFLRPVAVGYFLSILHRACWACLDPGLEAGADLPAWAGVPTGNSCDWKRLFAGTFLGS